MTYWFEAYTGLLLRGHGGCGALGCSSRTSPVPSVASLNNRWSVRRDPRIHHRTASAYDRLDEARDSLLQVVRRGRARLCDRRRRAAGREGEQLDDPSRLRAAEPGLAALGEGAEPRSNAHPLRRARLRSL